MIKNRILKSGFKTAWTHKLRAILMILSIVIGIAALTVIVSLGKGTEEKVISQVKKLFSSNTIMVAAGMARMEGTQVTHSPSAGLKIADIKEIADRVENIFEWDAVQFAPVSEANYNGKNTVVSIAGHMPSGESVWNIVVSEGRFFSESENEGLLRVALIAPNVQKELFQKESGQVENSNPIGQQIKINNIPFRVIGTIAPRGMDPHGTDKDSEVLIPINTLLRRVVNLDYLQLAKFLIVDEKTINSTAEQVKQILRERHNITTGQNDDFIVVTPTVVKEMISNANKMFNLYLPLIAVVSLIVGSIVAANLMLLSVNERVKEIGLRKAVGAKSKDILLQFLIEASSITVFSGIFGIVLGIILLSQIVKIMNLPFTISWGALTACLIISVIAGVASGFLPARKAAAMQPARSLR